MEVVFAGQWRLKLRDFRDRFFTVTVKLAEKLTALRSRRRLGPNGPISNGAEARSLLGTSNLHAERFGTFAQNVDPT